MTEKKKNSKWVDAGTKGIFRIDEIKVAKPLDGKVAVIGANGALIASVEEDDVGDLGAFYQDLKSRLMD
ncbi:hypothetical protein ACSD7O_00315 [Methylorubrum extorquens]|jgi:hypothetical protein|uniref:hypothetical protein n=1 Tax=Methylorubrum extorquens TaxID=408 RepID=UPI002238FFD8|nr:hypothetical protein [Methylorubrum extorquens]UYW26439.1 hypothetical protein OKC48_24815 [Methylorubrum extorquens]